MATDFIEDMIAREEACDPEAIDYVFQRGRKRLMVRATSGEGAWRALDIATNDHTDGWQLISIDGHRA